MRTNPLPLLLVVVVGACGGPRPSPPVEVEAEDVSLTFFRSFESGTYVFHSQAELDSAWAAAPFKVYPVGIVLTEPEKPTYDYTEQMVVGLSLGVGKWCFKPNISHVERIGTETVVHYQVPTRSTLACLRDGPQIAFAVIARADGDVRFVQDETPSESPLEGFTPRGAPGTP